MPKIARVTGTITLTDHTTSEFSIQTDGGWHQWGADQSRLDRTADALDALTAALLNDNLLTDDDKSKES